MELTAQRYIRERSSVDPVSDCWLWSLSLTGDGYPQAKYKGQKISGHRLSFIAFNGEVPTVVRHTCDQPTCVNPAHLKDGTVADNQADMVQRGRSLYGAKNPRANLTEEQALEVYADPRPYPLICAEYGVWKGTVSAIKTGRSWSKVTGKIFNV